MFRRASCVPDVLKASWTHDNTSQSACVPGKHGYLRS